MNIKILVATHKKNRMPESDLYLPVHVGREGKEDIGYTADNTGDNISAKNANYSELTALYWAWKNLDADYIGLVHYRRYFCLKKKNSNKDDFANILNKSEAEKLLTKYDVILPKKRKYYIESLYSHYANTHDKKHLVETRGIIAKLYPDYIVSFDTIMKKTSGHMFNMFIMKKELLNDYCNWLFPILFALEKRVVFSKLSSFDARLFGRVSELLLNVWIEKNNIEYKEIGMVYFGKVDWPRKVYSFVFAKLLGKKYTKSF